MRGAATPPPPSPPGPPPGGGLDYARHFDAAMAFLLRNLLAEVAERGLPGRHHLYIAFQTAHEDVAVPEALRRRYPHEMRIVLQHRFRDLEVGEDWFAVTLEFAGRPERISVPLAAVTEFSDPSAHISYRFAQPDHEAEAANLEGAAEGGEAPPEGGETARQGGAEVPEGARAGAPVKVEGTSGGEEDGGGSSGIVRLDAYRRRRNIPPPPPAGPKDPA